MAKKPFVSAGISYETLEETLDIKPSSASLSIAMPKENEFQENRIALTPDAVGVLVNNGHQVSVEQSAGEGAHFSDKDYADAGAKIVPNKKTNFSK
jgi:alanine dehydrogenase